MKTKLKPEDFLVKNHCHSAIHLKEVWSPDMIEGNHYDRLLLAMEDYANERIKEHIENESKTIKKNP